MEIVDDYTITLHYDHPFYAYLQDFCWPDVNPMSAPEFIIPGDFQTISGVAGTGPYIYDEYVAGEYTRFVRNEDYWGEKPIGMRSSSSTFLTPPPACRHSRPVRST